HDVIRIRRRHQTRDQASDMTEQHLAEQERTRHRARSEECLRDDYGQVALRNKSSTGQKERVYGWQVGALCAEPVNTKSRATEKIQRHLVVARVAIFPKVVFAVVQAHTETKSEPDRKDGEDSPGYWCDTAFF